MQELRCALEDVALDQVGLWHSVYVYESTDYGNFLPMTQSDAYGYQNG